MIKQFFRDLPPVGLLNRLDDANIEDIVSPPGFIFHTQQAKITANPEEAPEIKINEILATHLDDGHYALCLWLLDLMADVVQKSDVNKMTSKNMAIVMSLSQCRAFFFLLNFFCSKNQVQTNSQVPESVFDSDGSESHGGDYDGSESCRLYKRFDRLANLLEDVISHLSTNLVDDGISLRILSTENITSTLGTTPEMDDVPFSTVSVPPRHFPSGVVPLPPPTVSAVPLCCGGGTGLFSRS